MDHLNQKVIDKVKERLWIICGSLRGLGSLFRQTNTSAVFETEELFGIGQLLEKLSEEVGILEDILNCGYDSTADERNGVDSEEESDES